MERPNIEDYLSADAIEVVNQSRNEDTTQNEMRFYTRRLPLLGNEVDNLIAYLHVLEEYVSWMRGEKKQEGGK